MYYAVWNYHSVFFPALSTTAFSTGIFVRQTQAVSTAGHRCAFTCCLQYKEVLTWQAELTEEQQYHEQGLWNGHNVPDRSSLKPHRSCAWAEPQQQPHNVFSSLQASEMQAFNFSLSNKRVFTVFDLLTSRQCIALQSCSSGVALGKMGLSWYFSGQNATLSSMKTAQGPGPSPNNHPIFPNPLTLHAKKEQGNSFRLHIQ